MKKYLIVAACGAAFGFFFGYFGISYDHDFQSSSDYHESSWWELLTLPSIPGTIIAQLHWDYDWCQDEAWDYLWPITTFNTVFWLVAFPAFLSLVRAT